jgi:hypothetical protein
MHTNNHKRISKETNLPRDCASSLKLCRQATSAGWSDRLGNELKIPDRLTHPRGWTWTVLQNACTDNHRYAQLYDSNISCPILYDSIVVHLCSSKFIFRSVQRNISQHLATSRSICQCPPLPNPSLWASLAVELWAVAVAVAVAVAWSIDGAEMIAGL